MINNSVNPEWNEVFEVSKEALKVQGMYEAWSAVQARSQKILIPQFKLMQVLLSKQFSEKASDITERWLTTDKCSVLYSSELRAKKHLIYWYTRMKGLYCLLLPVLLFMPYCNNDNEDAI